MYKSLTEILIHLTCSIRCIKYQNKKVKIEKARVDVKYSTASEATVTQGKRLFIRGQLLGLTKHIYLRNGHDRILADSKNA